MLDIPDVPADILGAFFKRAMDSRIAQYATLLLEMGIAGVVSYMFTDGFTTLAYNATIGHATGLMVAAVCMAATFGASKNSKGLTVCFPSAEAEKQENTNIETLHKT